MPPLRTVREQRRLSVRELAKAAGVALALVLLTELGEVIPDAEVAQRIAAVLNVDWQTIWEFHERPPGFQRPNSDDGGSPAPVPSRPRRPLLSGAAEADPLQNR